MDKCINDEFDINTVWLFGLLGDLATNGVLKVKLIPGERK